MDGASFDRLSMVVDRLRDRASRRGAVRLLLSGSVAAATGLLIEDTDAKHRNRRNRHRNCRGFGGWCNGHNDCCSGSCINNHCFPGNGRGHDGQSCGGRTCTAGWGCCNNAGISVCVPNSFPTCCGGNSFVGGYYCCGGGGGACPAGWDCCGGFNQCCGPNQQCCGNGRCCPIGWFCGDIACFADQDQVNGVAAQSVESVPFSDPVTVDPSNWITLPA
jgi:hypothetical protein